jgi:phage recombination protein Bet
MTTATTAIEISNRPDHDHSIVSFSDDKKELLKRTICKDSTDDEFELFLHACKHTGLDPFMRQIHAVKRYQDGKQVMAIQTGIDGYRLIAERTNRYMPGPKPTYEYDEADNLIKATAYVKKLGPDGQWHTIDADAFFDEYVCTTREGNPNRMWATKRHIMLGKCAEALALRKAFPAEMSGIYTSEEMEQANNEAPLRHHVDNRTPKDDDQRPTPEIFNEKWLAAIKARGLPTDKANSVLSATLQHAKKELATAPANWLQGLLDAVAAGKFDAALKKEAVTGESTQQQQAPATESEEDRGDTGSDEALMKSPWDTVFLRTLIDDARVSPQKVTKKDTEAALARFLAREGVTGSQLSPERRRELRAAVVEGRFDYMRGQIKPAEVVAGK